MTFNRYSITVILPNLIFCAVFGKTAKAIERFARQVRLSCANRMQRVIMDAPPRKKNG